MKILVVGAGAIGGYFGGRLIEKGEDVTFLVRENRKKQLEKTGLKIESVNGNIELSPRLLLAGETEEKFDVIMISTKSYQLTAAIDDIRLHLKDDGIILPLLNGISHMDELVKAFGEDMVIGGLCFIESTLNEFGTIVQTSPIHQLVYGERTGERSPRIERLKYVFEESKAEFVLSDNINQDMWHKYLFITTMSGITSLMESSIGPIRNLESGQRIISALLNEIVLIMKKINAPIKDDIADIQLKRMNGLNEGMKSSMQRDIEKSLPIEVEHLQGYLLEKAKNHNLDVPILETIYTKLTLYEEFRK
ncbi:ketopantoate reductase family protein [Paenisporosarcina antarctica]|uniref:2-dehydropantoate 2-reductase n=1 Tax=Paenisporosarcina antarctica TaxID=417367 RepID=A0A4P7A290_9BACL|nr:ketopantoate reductase family protein [Paenisporosarcina antarctica]QBP42843.1 ketopantoate reductase family protein [Paenisporosarcina antarctica]